MTQEVYDRVLSHPKFAELTASRNRFSWTLAILVLAVFFAFILAVAYWPESLGAPLTEGKILPVGLAIGVAFNTFCFVMTGIYVLRANSRFDALNREILEETAR